MKWNNQTQQEARQLVEALTEKQWEAVKTAIPALVKPSSPEQVKAQEKRREQAKAQRDAMQKDYATKQKAFRQWKEKKLKGFQMPTAYDFIMSDVDPLTQYVLHDCAEGNEGYFDTLSFMYDWGFMRGMKCQKKKAAANGANVDNGKRVKG